MTVFKDARNLADDSVDVAVYYIKNHTLPHADGTYNNGAVNVPVKYSSVITIEKANIVSVLINSGYFKLSDFVWPGNKYLPLIIH